MSGWWVIPSSVGRKLSSIQSSLVTIEGMLNKIMSQDAAVAAVAADIENRVTDLANVMASVKGTVDQLLGEVANGTSSVSAETLARLQSDQAALDAAISAAQIQATDEATAANPAPPPAPTA
jgi:hypothetical protein